MPDVAKTFRDTFGKKVLPDRPGHPGPTGQIIFLWIVNFVLYVLSMSAKKEKRKKTGIIFLPGFAPFFYFFIFLFFYFLFFYFFIYCHNFFIFLYCS